MRLFFALELPEETKAMLVERSRDPRNVWGVNDPENWRWTPQENLHITVRFLGEVPEEKLAAIKAAAAAIPRVGPLDLSAGRVDFFPPRGRHRIFIVHFAIDVATIERLCSGIDEVLQPLGVPREKRQYKPHVTLARSRDRFGAKLDLWERVRRHPTLGGIQCRVENLTLFQSQLSKDGAVYTAIEWFPLA
jgi:2'-5' RNA ligase